MQNPSKLIQVVQVSKTFSKESQTGIHHISFELEKGKIYVILGESGSGKSTLLKSIYGLIQLDEGHILCEGGLVLGPTEKLIPGHPKMKMVTQDAELNTFATVYDNIAAQFPNTNLEEKHQKTEEIIQILRLQHLKKHPIKNLSGGEQQRVALAKAMVTQPPILLLDEPFSQLDTLLKNQLRTDILHLKSVFNTTIILVSHDPSDAYFLADEVLILKDGYLQQKNTVTAIKNHPQNSYIAKLFGNATRFELHSQWKNALQVQNTHHTEICIYPEDIEIHTQEKHNTLKATIIKAISFSFYQYLILHVLDQDIPCISTQKEIQYAENQEIHITFQRYFTF